MIANRRVRHAVAGVVASSLAARADLSRPRLLFPGRPARGATRRTARSMLPAGRADPVPPAASRSGLPFEPKERPLVAHVTRSISTRTARWTSSPATCWRTGSSGSARLRAGRSPKPPLGAEVRAPAHAEAVDLDRDGDLDLVVASLGVMFPSNAKIGVGGRARERRPRPVHQPRARRSRSRAWPTCAPAISTATAISTSRSRGFGYDDGETRWMENLGNWRFESTHAAESVGADQRRGGRSRRRRRPRHRVAREPGVGGGLRASSTTGAAGSSRC